MLYANEAYPRGSRPQLRDPLEGFQPPAEPVKEGSRLADIVLNSLASLRDSVPSQRQIPEPAPLWILPGQSPAQIAATVAAHQDRVNSVRNFNLSQQEMAMRQQESAATRLQREKEQNQAQRNLEAQMAFEQQERQAKAAQDEARFKREMGMKREVIGNSVYKYDESGNLIKEMELPAQLEKNDLLTFPDGSYGRLENGQIVPMQMPAGFKTKEAVAKASRVGRAAAKEKPNVPAWAAEAGLTPLQVEKVKDLRENEGLSLEEAVSAAKGGGAAAAPKMTRIKRNGQEIFVPVDDEGNPVVDEGKPQTGKVEEKAAPAASSNETAYQRRERQSTNKPGVVDKLLHPVDSAKKMAAERAKQQTREQEYILRKTENASGRPQTRDIVPAPPASNDTLRMLTLYDKKTGQPVQVIPYPGDYFVPDSRYITDPNEAARLRGDKPTSSNIRLTR